MNMHAPIHSFAPATDSRALRNAFSRFATGVTVVTAMTPDGPIGMTANSFSSVSLDPPLTLWSIDRKSGRYDVFANTWDTAIHVLAQDQEALCLAFARKARAFDEVNWNESPNGVPLIEGCLARFECRRYGRHDAGDHTILVDQIMHATVQQGGQGDGPLTFFQGSFGSFAEPAT
ncbi:MAG: flavin reductase family protein [Hyphomicrobiales bacterium]